MGMFGENFTTEGLLESDVFVGDRFRIGSAEVVVTQPRLPCYKLGVKFESDEIVRRFLASARTGFYLAVAREGAVAAEDEIVFLGREPNSVPVAEITRLYVARKYSGDDVALARRTLSIAALPDSWKNYFREQLEQFKG
jgi:MOSC domain-containing protein YiiM